MRSLTFTVADFVRFLMRHADFRNDCFVALWNLCVRLLEFSQKYICSIISKTQRQAHARRLARVKHLTPPTKIRYLTAVQDLRVKLQCTVQYFYCQISAVESLSLLKTRLRRKIERLCCNQLNVIFNIIPLASLRLVSPGAVRNWWCHPFFI